jgi:(1->4)-alpha-D-glucan 1-alpha-D-glucosylmutase
MIKLYVTHKALAFRRANAALFATGSYRPLWSNGKLQENVCAFAREMEESWAIAVAPRLTAATLNHENLPLGEFWNDAVLMLPEKAPNRWHNILTREELETTDTQDGKRLPISSVLGNFPVALLANKTE